MAEEEAGGAAAKGDNLDIGGEPKSKLPLIIIAVVLVVGLGSIGAVVMMKEEKQEEKKEIFQVEYQLPERMYQLKDGSYLKMTFSLVLDDNKVDAAKNILEKEAPGRLPHGLNMLLGNKSREELINGTHKREALAREIKRMIEDRVFRPYNQKVQSPADMIEIKDVLINDFVTQGG